MRRLLLRVLWKRLLRLLARAWDRLRGRRDDEDDPDALLQRAQRQMQELHAHNRERAVEAITQKNNLAQMVEDTEQRVKRLKAEAGEAESGGDPEEASRVRAEAHRYEETLAFTRQMLVQAEETVAAVKEAVQREEERIRRKSAEAMALRAECQLKLLTHRVEQAHAPQRERDDEASAFETFLLPPRARVVRHAQTLERFARAVDARNWLQQLANDTQKRVDNLQAKADLAAGRGDEALQNALLAERTHHLVLLPGLLASAARAETIVAEIRTQITADEDRLRREIPDFGVLLAQARAELKIVRAAEASRWRWRGPWRS